MRRFDDGGDSSDGRTLPLAELWPRRVIDDDDAPVGQRANGVARVARHDRYDARSHDLRDGVHSNFELARDDFVHFLLWVEVLVDRRTGLELVVGKRHRRREEEAALPARQALDDFETARVQERHTALRVRPWGRTGI